MSLIVSDTGFFPSRLRRAGDQRRRPQLDVASPSPTTEFESVNAGAIPVGIAAETKLAMSNLEHVEASPLSQVLKQYRMV